MREPVKIEIVQGVGGLALYINDWRVCGNKPWGGGRTIKTWTLTDSDAENLRERVMEATNA